VRVLFSSLPSYGFVYPLIPLAITARDAGHDVVFATDASFHANVQVFGLPTVAAGMTVADALEVANGRPLDREDVTRRKQLAPDVFCTVLPRRFVRDLAPVLEDWQPDLVVYAAANIGASFAAKRAGVPVVCHGHGLTPTIGADTGRLQRLTAVAAEAGVPFSGTVVSDGGDPYLDICPPSLQVPAFLRTPHRIPLRPVAINEPVEIPRWVLERNRRRPLIYLTLGTAFGGVEVLRQAIAALTSLDVDVLVAVGRTLELIGLGDVPENVRVERWVPQADLLPHVDVAVHHGGTGTTLAALAAGVPQLILPQGADHPRNAEAVTTAGAGEQLPVGGQSAEAIAAKVAALLEDGAVRARARALADEIAGMPSTEDILGRLSELAASRIPHDRRLLR
jgi:UDP:flavonoid glycosyltransferase YjiC (YdhE family)